MLCNRYLIILAMYIFGGISCSRYRHSKVDQNLLKEKGNPNAKIVNIIHRQNEGSNAKGSHVPGIAFPVDSRSQSEQEKEYIAGKEKILENLRKIKDNIEDVDALAAISDVFKTIDGKAFLNFYNPFNTDNGVTINMGRYYSENWDETYKVEIVEKVEIEDDPDLKRKVTNNEEVFIYQYAEHTPSILGEYAIGKDGPSITGWVYSIQDASNETTKISGFLTLDFGKKVGEKIRITFGTKMFKNTTIGKYPTYELFYDNDVVVDKNNTPKSGILTLEYEPQNVASDSKGKKTYDLSKLNPEETIVLKNLKILNIQ